MDPGRPAWGEDPEVELRGLSIGQDVATAEGEPRATVGAAQEVRRPVADELRAAAGKAKISRPMGFLKNCLKRLTVARFALVVFVLPALFYLYDEVTHNALIIDPINVPRSFEEVGFTPAVLANRIGDALRNIEESTQTQMKKESLRSLQEEGLIPDVEIPGTKFGVKEVVDITRSIFKIYPKHITGDVVVSSADPNLSLAKVRATVTIYVTKGRNRSAALRVDVPADSLDLLAEKTAELVLRQVNPYVLALYKKQQGEDELSLEIVEGMLQDPQLDPRHRSAAYNFLGNVLDERKKYDQAIAKYQEAISFDKKDAAAYNNWGNVLDEQNLLHEQKKYDEAIARYQKAIELDAEFAAAYIGWGEVLAKQKKPDYDKAIARYRKATELDPKSALAYNQWGNVLDKQKKYDQALAKYKKAIELDPKLALDYTRWGTEHADQYEEAIAKYQKAAELDPSFALAYIGWGNVLDDQQKYEEAIAKYQKAIELDPKSALAYKDWGNVLDDQQKYEEAIAKYHQAMELDPKDAVAYALLGNVLADGKRYGEAIAEYQKAIKLDPKSTEAYTDLGNVLDQQNVLDDQQKYDEAIAQYQKAIELDPEFAAAYLGWGNVLFHRRRYHDAIEKYEEAIELDPTDKAAHEGLDKARGAQEKQPEAKNKSPKAPLVSSQ